ncbi:MAG: hypothetical protein ABSC94_04405 [Polyangiaceae bacterium]
MNRPLYVYDWPDGAQPPPGYRWTTHTRKGPIIAGAVVLGVLWGLTAIGGGACTDISRDTSCSWLYLPVLGPFAELASSGSATGSVFLVMDGLGQAAGLALLIYGISSPASVLVRNDVLMKHLLPMPMLLGKNGSGFGLAGTF